MDTREHGNKKISKNLEHRQIEDTLFLFIK